MILQREVAKMQEEPLRSNSFSMLPLDSNSLSRCNNTNVATHKLPPRPPRRPASASLGKTSAPAPPPRVDPRKIGSEGSPVRPNFNALRSRPQSMKIQNFANPVDFHKPHKPPPRNSSSLRSSDNAIPTRPNRPHKTVATPPKPTSPLAKVQLATGASMRSSAPLIGLQPKPNYVKPPARPPPRQP